LAGLSFELLPGPNQVAQVYIHEAPVLQRAPPVFYLRRQRSNEIDHGHEHSTFPLWVIDPTGRE
jgi:hypothetical protein